MGTGRIIQADNIDGLKTVKNYISNGLATLNTTGWTTYKDAAGTRPVDGTGGTATLVSFTRSTTSPLSDAASFLFTVTGGSSAQGEGASYNFTIDAAYKAKVLKIEADYIVNSGTFAAGSSTTDSDVIVYIYDVTNGVLIEPSSFKFLSNSTTISDKFSATFQTSATGTSYRLIFHVASTSTAAYALKFDNISVSPSQYVFGTPITDWQSYTPTGSWTTNTTYSGRWRRVGDSVEVRGSVNLTGAPNAANLTINLPSGMTIDTNKTPARVSSTNIIFGVANVYNGAGSTWTNARVSYNSTTSILLTVLGNASNDYNIITATVPITFANNTAVFFEYSVPILGWSSSVQVSDGYDGQNVSTKMYPSGNLTGLNPNASAVKLNINAAIIDKVGGANTASNRIEIKTSGVYDVKAAIELAGTNILSGGNYRIYIYKNGSAWRFGYITFPVANGNTTSLIGDFPNEEFVADDYLELYLYSGPNHSVNTLTALGGTNMITFLSVEKLSGHPTISATETVSALYKGGPPTGTLSAAYNLVTFGTKVKDSHGAYSSGSYTVPASGQYDIEAQISVQATVTANHALELAIFIDGAFAYAHIVRAQASVTTYFMPHISVKAIPLLAGRVVSIRSYADGTSVTYQSNAGVNFFSITRSGGY